MLLNLLSKEEKFYFIDLLCKVFTVDGAANDFEKRILELYKTEMGDETSKHRHSNLDFNKLVEYFASRSKTTKNIVYYNIVFVSLSDEFYSVEVHELLDQIQHELMITNKKKIELLKVIYAEKDLKEKAKRLMFEW